MGNRRTLEKTSTTEKSDSKRDKSKNTRGKGVGDIPKGRLVHDPSEELSLYYELTNKLLGTGNFSVVKKGIAKGTKEAVAIKIIDKKRVKHKPEMLSNEVEILIKIDHRNVIKLLDLFDTPDYLYLVMELVTGGELFDRIVERESYSEADAKEVMRQLLNAIKYIHANDIVHRDLKPENLLLEMEDNDVNIKLSDFGLSKIYDNEFLMKTACGTPGYVAPEILSANPYGPAVDMWSAGVICYILLCGYPPFYNDNDAILFESILNAKYQFHSPYWDQISKPAKDLIRALLVVDPQARLNATQALEMEWFSISTSSSEQPLPHQLKEKLTLFREESKIKSNIKASLITVGKKNN